MDSDLFAAEERSLEDGDQLVQPPPAAVPPPPATFTQTSAAPTEPQLADGVEQLAHGVGQVADGVEQLVVNNAPVEIWQQVPPELQLIADDGNQVVPIWPGARLESKLPHWMGHALMPQQPPVQPTQLHPIQLPQQANAQLLPCWNFIVYGLSLERALRRWELVFDPWRLLCVKLHLVQQFCCHVRFCMLHHPNSLAMVNPYVPLNAQHAQHSPFHDDAEECPYLGVYCQFHHPEPANQ